MKEREDRVVRDVTFIRVKKNILRLWWFRQWPLVLLDEEARRCSNGLVKVVEIWVLRVRENFWQLLFKISFPSLQNASAKFMCLVFILLTIRRTYVHSAENTNLFLTLVHVVY